MKKTLLVLALTTVTVTTAQAASELYGSIQLGMNYGYYHTPTEGNMRFYSIGKNSQGQEIYKASRVSKRALAIEDTGSYLGLRGFESLGENVSIIYDLKWAFNAADGGEFGEGFENEIAMLGLQSDLGTLALGRQENGYYETIMTDTVADDFNALEFSASSAAASDVMFGKMGSLNTFDAEMLEYLGYALSYTSPSLAGLTFNTSVVMGRDDDFYNQNRNVGIYTLNLKYEHESGFYTKLGYLAANLDDGAKNAYSYGTQLGFRTDDWGITGSYAHGKNKNEAGFDSGNAHSEKFWESVLNPDHQAIDAGFKHTSNGWDLGAYWSFGADQNSTIRATFGQAKSIKKHQAKETNRLTTWSLGFEQALSEKTALWVEYEYLTVKQQFATNDVTLDYVDRNLRSKRFKDDTLSIGIRHDF